MLIPRKNDSRTSFLWWSTILFLSVAFTTTVSLKRVSLIADSCTNIKKVGKPVTHNARYYTQGAWMKDPLGIMGAETIFVMKSYYSRNVLEEFQNMDMFKAGITRKTYKLPYNYDGTGAVVYGPYLYYNR